MEDIKQRCLDLENGVARIAALLNYSAGADELKIIEACHIADDIVSQERFQQAVAKLDQEEQRIASAVETLEKDV